MSGTISSNSVVILLGCGAVLPLAACFAALPDKEGNRTIWNNISLAIGLIAISIVAIVLFQYR